MLFHQRTNIYTSHLKLNVHLCFITRTIKVFCYTLRSSLKLKPRWHMRLKKIPMRLFFKLQTHAPDNTTPRAVSNPPAHPIPLFSPSSADSSFFCRSRHLDAYTNVLKICRGRQAPPPSPLHPFRCRSVSSIM